MNDDCYDLLKIEYIDVGSYRSKLINSDNLEEQVKIISDLMIQLIQSNKVPENDKIQHAIAIILENSGQIKVTELLEQLYMTERTFERNFMSQVGLTPKFLLEEYHVRMVFKTSVPRS